MAIQFVWDGPRVRAKPVHVSAVAHIAGVKVYGPEAVMHRDGVAVLAKRLGMPAPFDTQALPPLPCAHVEWGSTLRDYQKVGVERITKQLRFEGGAILADDMGLGKTLQTLAVWEELGRPGPLLICCPASVRRTWLKEVAKWCSDVEPVLADTGAKAAKLTNATKVAITSYNLASSKLPKGYLPQMMVFDEAHLLRGRRAKRSQELFDISRVANYRLALTGTPQWSRPRDWWMLLKILFGYRFGTADDFDYAYCGAKINQWGGKDNKGATRIEELKLRLEHVMLRRTKEEVASDIPKLTRIVKWVKSTPEAKRASDAFVMGALSCADALAATLVAKFETTVDAMVEAGKSLVFTWQKAHVYELKRLAEEVGLEVETITGDDTHAERAAAVERAVLYGRSVVATIDSTGTGVDGLQHVASTGIYHAIDWVPTKLAQGEARLQRIGALNPITFVYVVMEDTVDQRVLETVVEKLEQWTDVMGTDATSGIGTTLYASTSRGTDAEVLAAIKEAFND